MKVSSLLIMMAALTLWAPMSLTCAEALGDGRANHGKTSIIHISEGMWSQLWNLPEALGDSGTISESFLCSRYGFHTWLKGFPTSKEALFSNRVLILANVPADSFLDKGSGRSDEWVEEFLAQGGGVFVLGGNYSLGTGGNIGGSSFGDLGGTAMQRFLPAEIHAHDINLGQQNQPVACVANGKQPLLSGIDWSASPVTMFYHEVTPRAGTQVIIKAGNAPILILGAYKRGRIALWTATLHGEPPAGSLAYWRWKEWPALVRAITRWLAHTGP